MTNLYELMTQIAKNEIKECCIINSIETTLVKMAENMTVSERHELILFFIDNLRRYYQLEKTNKNLTSKLEESTKLAHPDYVELQQLREFKKMLCQNSRRTATEIDQSVRIIELERKLEQLNCDGNCSNEKQKYKKALEKIIEIQGEEYICEQCMASYADSNHCTTECEQGVAKQALGIEIKPYSPFKIKGEENVRRN